MKRALLIEMEYSITRERSVKLCTLLYVTTKKLTKQDIEYINRLLAKTQHGVKPVHMVMLLHTGVIDPEVSIEIPNLEQRYAVKIVDIPIVRLMDRIQLAAIGRSIWESAEDGKPYLHAINIVGYSEISKVVDLHELIAKLRELWDSLSLEHAIESVLKQPFALEDLALEPPLSSYRDYVNALRWALAIPRRQASVPEIFTYVVRELASLHIYGTKRSLLGLDIESPAKLREYLKVLSRYGFVKFEGDNVVPDVLSPYEQRVIDILSRIFNGIATESTLKKFFIAMSPNAERVWETILSTLEIRALICRGKPQDVKRMGVDLKLDIDGDNIVVLLAIPERARKIVDEWYRRILSIIERDRELATKFGYIVSAKERRYNWLSISKFFDTVMHYIEVARKALDFDVQQGLRLARLALDMMEYYENELRPLIQESEKRIKRLKHEMVMTVNDIVERLKMLEELLSSYIFTEKISIDLLTVHELNDAVKLLDEIAEKQLNDEEVLKELDDMWKRYRGKEFPFYFRGQGPLYMFNYKLWLIHSKLRNVVDIDRSGITIRQHFKDAIERIEKLVNYVKKAIEEAENVDADRETLAEKLRSSEILTSLAKAIDRIEFTKLKPIKFNVSTVDELERLVRDSISLWHTHIRSIAVKLTELQNAVDKVIALEEELARHATRLRHEVEKYKGLIDGCGNVFEHAPQCYKEIELVGQIVNKVLDRLEKMRREYVDNSKTLSIDDIRRVVLTVGNELGEAMKELSSATLVGCKHLAKETIDRVKTLAMQIKSLSTLLQQRDTAKIAELETRLKDLNTISLDSGICTIIGDMYTQLKELRKRILESNALNNDEIEVYVALTDIKSSRGSLRFSEAVELISQRLGIERTKVKSILLSLISKDLIEAYL